MVALPHSSQDASSYCMNMKQILGHLDQDVCERKPDRDKPAVNSRLGLVMGCPAHPSKTCQHGPGPLPSFCSNVENLSLYVIHSDEEEPIMSDLDLSGLNTGAKS
jgi:hypothetical protein